MSCRHTNLARFRSRIQYDGPRVQDLADQPDHPTAATFAELKRRGVRFRERQFESKVDFAELRENIIVNCTGYGARAIMSDQNVIARRGHLVLLKRTLPKQFYFFSGGCSNGRIMYVFCRQNDIVVGGTSQRGNDSETIGEPDQGHIRANLEQRAVHVQWPSGRLRHRIDQLQREIRYNYMPTIPSEFSSLAGTA